MAESFIHLPNWAKAIGEVEHFLVGKATEKNTAIKLDK